MIVDRARYEEIEARELAAVNDLTVGIEKVRREIAHMRGNAERARDYVSFSRERFLLAPAEQARAVAKALGARFLLYGREKKVEVEIAPLLREFVDFARQETRPFEPAERCSNNVKSAHAAGALYAGWAARGENERVHETEPCAQATDLPESLVEALKGPHFPDVLGGPERG